MSYVWLPDKLDIDGEAPWFTNFGEPYVFYLLSLSKEEMGQSISVSFFGDKGNTQPYLVGGFIHRYERLAFLSPEVVYELVRRAYQLIPRGDVHATAAGTGDHGQGDGQAGGPQPVDG